MNDHTKIPTIKIMVSSTTMDLKEYRDKAFEIIKKIAEDNQESLQILPVGMEFESQTGERETAIEISKNWVEKSHWVVVVLGWWYGTITKNEGENPDGLSPTHWEYLHAMELMKTNPKKRVFVFITGEKKTTDEYRELNSKYKDLKDSKDEGTEDQQKKIQQFRKEISGPHLSHFKDLDDFKTKLEKTLRRAITDWEKVQEREEPDKKNQNQTPGKGLAALILEFKIPIKTCIRKVRLLTDYKEIHDRLHKIRQMTIRPWREQVIPQWSKDSKDDQAIKDLDQEIKDLLVDAGRNSSKFLESIKTILENDPSVDDKTLLIFLSKIIEMDFDENKDFAKSIYIFSDNVDLFSSLVQRAFTRANAIMKDQSASLYELREQLANSLSLARKDHPLTPEDDGLFDKWVDEFRQTRILLDSVLTTHNDWQSLHNELEPVDANRMSKDSFPGVLKRFCDCYLEILENLILDWKVLLSSIDNPTYESRARSLEVNLAALSKDPTLSKYDPMKKAFDDVFFDFDRFTLVQVKKSKAKVDAFDQLLDELGQRPV